jgi:hypothetical protein
MRKFIYVAHPLGAGPDRTKNLLDAAAWCAWVADQRDVDGGMLIPIAPWISVAAHWPETRRDEGLALDLATIDRCDEVWLCGPRVSPGMRIEAEHARAIGLPVRRVLGWLDIGPREWDLSDV